MPGMDATSSSSPTWRSGTAFLILLGLYLTVRGYHSFDGDQAYRFPILRRAQDLRLFASDPFVRAFERFNPHRGYLAVLDVVSRPAGLAAGVLALYVVTFAATCLGVARLARAVWSEQRSETGVVAIALVLIAAAGNIGTNHLFEPILLDRLVGFALGWVGLAAVVSSPRRGGWVAWGTIGLAGIFHPSVGLQLSMVLSGGWIAWWFLGMSEGVNGARFVGFLVGMGLAALPGAFVNLRHSELLTLGLSPERVRLLSAELQSPQHMIPHLWRLSQWVAWVCYPALGFVSLKTAIGTETPARRRVAVLIAVLLVGLGVAWLGIERWENLRLTLFQPFRMATVTRGLCVVLVAGHLVRLWETGSLVGRFRALLLTVGFAGDRLLAVVTVFEVAMAASDLAWVRSRRVSRTLIGGGFVFLAWGLVFLSRHDTASGHLPLFAVILTAPALHGFVSRRPASLIQHRLAYRLAAAWVVPLAALAANFVPEAGLSAEARGWRLGFVRRCRFAEIPVDDIERLAVWCRVHTPTDAVFIGPPGPKTFRLWSSRNLAFNRAGSPYAAEGLADWASRFADHVGVRGRPEALVAAYLQDRHGLENRYDGLSPDALSALARRQGAGYVIARTRAGAALIPLHTEGRYTVYVVTPPALASRGHE